MNERISTKEELEPILIGDIMMLFHEWARTSGKVPTVIDMNKGWDENVKQLKEKMQTGEGSKEVISQLEMVEKELDKDGADFSYTDAFIKSTISLVEDYALL